MDKVEIIDQTHIVILGAGCIGLSTASALLQSNLSPNLKITIVASEFSPNTTSDIAGGLWLPFQADHPLLNDWCFETYKMLEQMKSSGTFSFHESISCASSLINQFENPFGIQFVDNYSFEAGDSVKVDRDTWKHLLKTEPLELPSATWPSFPKYASKCWKISQLPLIQTSVYLAHLRRLLDLTGKVLFIKDKHEGSLRELASKYSGDVVINCSGIGARSLLGDDQLVPVRGCIVTMEIPPHIYSEMLGKVYSFDDNPEGMTYIMPHPHACLVGGTYFENEWNTTCSDVEANEILRRAVDAVPQLKHGKIVKQCAGLRPRRSTIRCEYEPSTINNSKNLKNVHIFHNYGHGGSGWTVHWGCAKTCVDQVISVLSKPKINLIQSKL